MVKKKIVQKKNTAKKQLVKSTGVKSLLKKVKPKSSPKGVLPVKKSSKAKMVKAAAKVAQVPVRAPVKRVMQGDRSLMVVSDRAPALAPSVDSVVVSKVIAPTLENVFTPAATREEEVLPSLPRFAWGNLPKTLPVQTRFYLSMAEKECRAANSWPFPFARFIAALPDEICGRSMALMLMALEHQCQYLAETFGLTQSNIEKLLRQERAVLLERCSTHCPEMYRKMKTQLGGVGVSIETLIEKYLVSRVDRNFQLVIGALVLQALVE